MNNGHRMRPFERSLPMQLMRAREIVMARFRPHLNAHGVTDQQWRIIRALNETDGLEIADLGRAVLPASGEPVAHPAEARSGRAAFPGAAMPTINAA